MKTSYCHPTATREDKLEAMLILTLAMLRDLHEGYPWGYPWDQLGTWYDDMIDDAKELGVHVEEN